MPFLEAFSYKQDLIEYVSNELLKNSKNNHDLSKYAVVFPGKRPNLYLINKLSEKFQSAFIPPKMFSISEFMRYVSNNRTEMPLLDAVYEIFKIIKEQQNPLKNQVYSSFEDFIFWGIEIYRLIEELDVELVNDTKFKTIDLPGMSESVKRLLNNLPIIRKEFHNIQKQKRLTTRGLDYLDASELIKQRTFDEFEHIYFVGLIILTKAETEVIKTLLKGEKASLFTQVESINEPLASNLSKYLEMEFSDYHFTTDMPRLNLYKGCTIHEEVEYVYDILNDKNLDVSKTAIVLPDSSTLLPLLSNVMDYLPYDYNVTMGYPLKRTSFYTLINEIFNAQLSRKEQATGKELYYAKDYLNLIKHPYIKGMHNQVIHFIVNQIESYLINKGNAFIELEELEDTKNNKLYNSLDHHMKHLEQSVTIEMIHSYIKELHQLFFKSFEPKKQTVIDFANAIDRVINTIIEDSSAIKYKFSPSFIKGLLDTVESLRQSEFKNELFEKQKLFKLFNSYIDTQTIPFNGIPLKGLQILGLLETRTLNFDTVIVLDCNEGIIPASPRYDPLLPFKIKRSLNLPTYIDQEQVYRYHFRRLIKSANNVHLIYRENDEIEKSRFIEEIIWDEEKKEKRLIANQSGGLEQLEGIAFYKKQFKTEIKDYSREDIKKDQNTINIVLAILKKGLSPTIIDQYLSCPAMFYYNHVLGLQEIEELTEEPEAKEIGKFIHEVLEQFYSAYVNKQYIYSEHDDNRLKNIINEKFEKTFHGEDNGVYFLLKEIVLRLLKEFIRQEGNKKPYIVSLEKQLCAQLGPINGINVELHGKIDRIDKYDSGYLIIDYKTGYSAMSPKIKKLKSIGKPLTNREEMKELISSFQLPVYLYLCYENATKLGIGVHDWEFLDASLYMIKGLDNSKKPLFNSNSKHNKKEFMEQLFIPSLKNLIIEMLNPDIPFTRDDTDNKRCSYCPFSGMCK